MGFVSEREREREDDIYDDTSVLLEIDGSIFFFIVYIFSCPFKISNAANIGEVHILRLKVVPQKSSTKIRKNIIIALEYANLQ